MTLKELARLAGVSVSTVSRVVNKNDIHAASEEIRNKIWDLVHETGYIPNISAQSLKSGTKPTPPQSRTIVCVFARTPNGKSDPFFSQIFRAVEHECIKSGYEMTGVFSASDLKRVADTFYFPHSDGIIVLGRYSRSLLKPIQNCSPNIVYTGLNAINDPYDQVICNGYEAAKAAVRYLHALGHRHIGYIGEKTEEARYRGYFDAIQELRLPLHREHILDSEQSMQGGYNSGLAMLSAIASSSETISESPTAVFCANDATAIGAMKAFNEHGMAIPDDISVISIDNTEICQFSSPMLTSIDIPKEELGKLAVKTMIDRIDGGHRLPMKIEIPFTIVTRESCAPPKKRQ